MCPLPADSPINDLKQLEEIRKYLDQVMFSAADKGLIITHGTSLNKGYHWLWKEKMSEFLLQQPPYDSSQHLKTWHRIWQGRIMFPKPGTWTPE